MMMMMMVMMRRRSSDLHLPTYLLTLMVLCGNTTKLLGLPWGPLTFMSFNRLSVWHRNTIWNPCRIRERNIISIVIAVMMVVDNYIVGALRGVM